MAQNVNSSMFKNGSKNNPAKRTVSGKKPVNPIYPFLLIVLLAIMAVAVQYWTLEMNERMYQQMQDEMISQPATEQSAD